MPPHCLHADNKAATDALYDVFQVSSLGAFGGFRALPWPRETASNQAMLPAQPTLSFAIKTNTGPITATAIANNMGINITYVRFHWVSAEGLLS